MTKSFSLLIVLINPPFISLACLVLNCLFSPLACGPSGYNANRLRLTHHVAALSNVRVPV